MIRRLAAALILGVAALAAPAVPAAAQAQRDWTQVVSQTPEGGFRMGNPDAPIKVVEFMSMTCPHCAAFSAEGGPRLATYVRSGRVSWEYRNFVLNGLDLAAALVSRCAAPQNYFALNSEIFARQQEWMNRMQEIPAEQRQQMEGLSPLETMQRVVSVAGLEAIAARHGVNAAQARTCLSNQAGLDRLVQMQQSGANFGVQGTPTFAINGRIAGTVRDWATLEPLLGGR
ncbi:thioredoxin domain-containing protein [Sphingosinicella sp. LHD-64]|uniref:thioredoxin domain-containing protein n=1 Tax=Sphingosinicella sp. LHD-64 TaxID=3072139 RepID=UPI00280ED0C8|nr:thioredoxin domain-containing protein [Sphingosinicella sp. LHD-64]MDQ8756571.1 thioredoxin domain-containing protein [Sphingosinicella sp. LHD-64]